jgi:hypothetical protein
LVDGNILPRFTESSYSLSPPTSDQKKFAARVNFQRLEMKAIKVKKVMEKKQFQNA